jgi:HSP20 family molecular chaperone IbpA
MVVAERSRPSSFHVLDEFERGFDALFDDLLARWRRPLKAATLRHTQVIERADHYEVRMTRLAGDARQTDLEASDRRLMVRSLGPAGAMERVVEFQHSIDPEAATARFEQGILTIVLPKKPARKIRVA